MAVEIDRVDVKGLPIKVTPLVPGTFVRVSDHELILDNDGNRTEGRNRGIGVVIGIDGESVDYFFWGNDSIMKVNLLKDGINNAGLSRKTKNEYPQTVEYIHFRTPLKSR